MRDLCTRRTTLKTATLAGTAVGLAGMAAHAAPGKKIKVALVGCGFCPADHVTALPPTASRGDAQGWEKRLCRETGGGRSSRLPQGDRARGAGAEERARHLGQDATVEVFVNGTLVNKGWNASATEGAICLQAEGADIQFRNIRIKQ